MIVLPALLARSSPAVDELDLDELLDLCVDEQVAAPPHPALWAIWVRIHAYTQTWRHALTMKAVALGGPRRAW